MRPRPLQPAWAHTRRDQVARLGVEYPQVAPVDDAIFAQASDLENVRDASGTVGPKAAHDYQIEVLGDHLADGVRVDALGGELGEGPELTKAPRGESEWSVPRHWWPVAAARSQSSASAPRHSPTTRTSGWSRRAVRISSRYVRAPAPSMFARWAYSGIAAG